MADDKRDSSSDSTGVDVVVAPTERIYLTYDGNFELNCQAKVLSCRRVVEDDDAEDGKDSNCYSFEIELDRSTMHPQGGGQPTDIGTIVAMDDDDGSSSSNSNNSETTLHITKVTLNHETGVVTHAGTLHAAAASMMELPPSLSLFAVDSMVRVSVDEQRRRLLSECHTAGHVVDSAMAQCDQVLPASKGYHFLDGPYVEYKGSIPPKDRPTLLTKLQQAFTDLVEQDIPTKIEMMNRNDARRLCPNFDLDTMFGTNKRNDDDDESESLLRIVTVAGWHCPCGGTHVRSTKDLKERQWRITGIKGKKDVVRIKYGFTSSD